MSSSNRTTPKGGKGSKTDNKSHKTDKADTEKNQKHPQNSTTHSFKSEDPTIKEKVGQLMDLSQRSEEEVCLALHECDYDVNSAFNMLFENMGHGEWETRVKKKKNRQQSISKGEKGADDSANDEWNDAAPAAGGPSSGPHDRDKSRTKSGPPRLHGRHNDSRGWRGRERHENERNAEEGGGRGDFQRRSRPPGASRGRGGGLGRGGGRAGGRFPPRGGSTRANSYNKPIETWDNSNNTWDSNAQPAAASSANENWSEQGMDEWTTEEYTGSLADTKVFTPSVQQAMDEAQAASDFQNAAAAAASASGLSIDNAVINSGPQGGGAVSPQLQQQQQQSTVQIGGALSAAQSQYLNHLTQQNSENIKQYGTAQTYHAQNNTSTTVQQAYANQVQQYIGTNSANGSNTYVTANSYSTDGQQPVRTKTQRARVPPPSKIPSSAVEMPGDINNSIGYLDVQFGAMDFLSDSTSYDSGVNDNTNKYTSTNSSGMDAASTQAAAASMDLNSSNQNSNTMDAYSPKSNTQSSISSALSQSLTNTDSIPQTSEHLTNAYNSATRNAAVTSSASAAPAGLELGKQGDSHSYSQSTNYNSYPTKNSNYSASTYSGTQTSNSYVSNQANSYANSQSYNTSGSGYQNAYSSAASYQSNTNATGFPSITQSNSSPYPSNNQSYQQNSTQSVYGANPGLNNSSNFGNTTTSQYNNYSATSNHKLGKESGYESSTVSSVQTTTSNATTSSLSLSQTTVSVTKATTTLAAKNSSSVISSIPPGVTPVMSAPYIMGQVPYFQQPVYSYEDMQMLQQRMPHMTTPYYDLSYQTPTTMATVRDAALSNVGYSISDGRFTRADNNASPVPSTLSQQTSTLTQGHQAQPILASGAHPYFFTAALNTFPNYQFGTMYTQLPPATNAHGSSNSNQYPKPATYASGYGNYDTLNQTQDYNKTGYVGNNQGQKGGGVNASSTGSSANDLSAMYGKTHAALGKGNSYEKQGFHSGTPPGVLHSTLHGGQSAGLAPSGTGYGPQVYIPTMTAHQQPLSAQLMHQPLHQMEVRHQGRRMDSGNNSGQRSQSSNQSKGGAKQPYQTSYWNQP